ncbi:arabinan endo-1,5-alpha-L-arabinosidase [Hymenobacter arizonensis]|uniref:Arabinan endo-1,5-alpha-L-arabinosidase n=2 Tax=Hymenobacter arizonensis TaxID=1227077 RepID=A0A1I5WWW5_HYMAR|nr:arabinan endo-1,5-alpha-L-arabinosidase [Hymenobacter arizonensis]
MGPTTTPPAHDPVMIRQNGTYYMFCTGMGIAVWSSKDMKTWTPEKPVFDAPPAWAVATVPSFRGHIWAPDISFANGQYSLFYSISAFGKNTSAIGLVTNKTLDPKSPDFKWVDHGKVIQSVPGRDMWNAIDPNLARDAAGTPWLTFGSFWSGMKLVKLKPDLTAPAQPEQWRTIARRPRDFKLNDSLPGDGAIEAPFIFKKDGFYYLFTSFDYCCRGPESTYKMVVGRAKEITGPYVDRAGLSLEQGGGTLVLAGDSKWFGVGHNAVATFDKADYLIFHGYDASDKGRPKLRVEKLAWDKEGWPAVTGK